ncbi:hypothetical protein IQ215_11565 [Cyanobacterium stanieri LEGE 03274]|uniref:Uncharacterized protein n=1 Tax=Cyanobacterium stanieri LEGE 03274 TaxID=1828756 RepID=A0ABR9V615_9CHRO|nr:DUF5331 domain-containing protein [Cyanobacterium stanieri]MBE9223335.1 hypothetical protein [Cyanobacterium stanieri LEGE 03274]
MKLKIKDKWLDYWAINKKWITLFCEENNDWYDTSDNGKRPPAKLILGIVTALELELSEYLETFLYLNSDEDAIIQALGLDFDPDVELKKLEDIRKTSPAQITQSSPSYTSPLDDFRKQILNSNNQI